MGFFDGQGVKTEVTDRALNFCQSFHQQMQQTIEFSKALQSAQILVERHANVSLPNGESMSLSGFRVVDEEKLRQLSAKTMQKFVERGWMGLIYAHLISMGSMNKLVSLLQTKAQ
jgi:hypothetical protein